MFEGNKSNHFRIHMIDGSGAYSSVLVGPVLDLDPEQEEEPVLQYLVPRDTWFASELGRIFKHNSYWNKNYKFSLFIAREILKTKKLII